MATTFAELKALWQAVSDWVLGISGSKPKVVIETEAEESQVISATVRATILSAEYIVTADAAKSSELLIANLDQYVGVEVALDEALGSYDSPNMITLEPGQSIKVGYIPAKIYYRSKAAVANIRFTFGRNLQMSPGLNKSVFQDMKTIRYVVRGVDPYSPAIYFAVNRQVRKSVDRGATSVLVYDFAPVSSGVVRNIFVTRAGTILVNVTNEVWRSTDGGASFTKVLDMNNWWRRHQGIVQNPSNGDIVFAENPDDAPADGYVKIWRSTDDGATWTAPATGQIAYPSEIRHFHSVQMDPFASVPTYIATTGDGNNQVKWLKSTDGRAAVWEDMEVPETQIYRTCGVLFTPTHYIWGSDNPSGWWGSSGVYSAKRDDVNTPTLLYATSGPIIGTRQINGLMLFSASGEGYSAFNNHAELIASDDWGVTWKRAFSWPKREDAPYASIGGISPPSFDGDIWVELLNCEGVSGSVVPYYQTLRVTP